MPNLPASRDDRTAWPRDLDDLRAQPGRILTTADLARLGVARSYGGLRTLPPSLRLPGRVKGWEARTVLAWLGAPLDTNATT